MDLRKTSFHSVRPGPSTKVYRVTTQSSVYLVGLLEVQGRRFAVLQGEAGTRNESLTMRDSDPQIGDRSLWTVAPQDWVGQPLTIATMTTSPIRSVVQDHSAESVALIRATQSSPALSQNQVRATAIVTGQRAAPRDEAQPQPTTYPETHVEYAESVAAYLRALLRRSTLFADVAQDSMLSRRLEVALADAVLSLERLAKSRR